MTTKKVTTKNNAALAKQAKQSESERYAKVSLSPATMSAVLADSFTTNIFPDLEISDVASALRDKITTIQAGDMQPIEAMLIGQAQALQTMFVSLGRQAACKTQLNQYTAFMNLALKAQSQSRATIQALTELKYPKQATFVKQANISNGHQQVNNTNNTHAPAHASENSNQPNELLEVNNGSQTMDITAATTTSATDPAMATVET
ncbi:MAG: hypothetical protein SFU55_05730 [Methylophilus sp.]|nr:hypothetical protein [Methylophilus sp.]